MPQRRLGSDVRRSTSSRAGGEAESVGGGSESRKRKPELPCIPTMQPPPPPSSVHCT